jgi:hypothetical protein
VANVFRPSFLRASSRLSKIDIGNDSTIVLVAPFIRPANKVGDTPPLPYYLYCLIGIAILVFGVLYWAVWQLALPYVFKFRLVPRKEVLEDGTVVTLVSQLTGFWGCSQSNGQG